VNRKATDQTALVERIEARRREAEARWVHEMGDHIDAYLARCMAPWREAIEGWGKAIEDLRTRAAALEQKSVGLGEDYLKEFVEVLAKACDERVVEMCQPLVERLAVLEKATAGTRERGGLQYKGVWTESGDYERQDAITWGGSVWIALQDDLGKPGTEDSGWRLAIKSGRHGKDGRDGEPGPPGRDGEPGRPGRDADVRVLADLERRIATLEAARK